MGGAVLVYEYFPLALVLCKICTGDWSLCDIIVVVAIGPITQLPCSLALMNAGNTYYALRNVLISADIVVKKANCTWPIKVYKRHKSGIESGY